jgi:hypothetical protein
MWLQDGDAKPQLFAPTYATVTRIGSVTSAKGTEGDAGYVTTVGYFYEIQNLNIQRSSSVFIHFFQNPINHLRTAVLLPFDHNRDINIRDMK